MATATGRHVTRNAMWIAACVLAAAIPAFGLITTDATKTTLACDGSSKTFTYLWPGQNGTDLSVYLRTTATGAETLLTLNSDYTVAPYGSSYASGGVVTTTSLAAYSSDYQIVIVRNVPLTQPTTIPNSATITTALDRIVLLIQDLQGRIDRCLAIPITDPNTDTGLADSVDRANTFLAFDANGAPVASAGGLDPNMTVSSYMQGVLLEPNSTALKTDLGVYDTCVNVLAYGAEGDGVTNDSNAIALALAAAEAAHRPLYFPAGTYLTDTIHITVDGTIVYGDGLESILKANTGQRRILDVNNPAGWARYINIHDLSLDMTNMTDANTVYGLWYDHGWSNRFTNITWLGDGGNKFSLYVATGAYTTVFENCNPHSTQGNIGIYGTSLGDAVTTLTFISCGFGHCEIDYAGSITFLQPIVQGDLDKFVLDHIDTINIQNGDIEGTGTYLVLGTYVRGLTSIGNVLSGMTYTTTSYYTGSPNLTWMMNDQLNVNPPKREFGGLTKLDDVAFQTTAENPILYAKSQLLHDICGIVTPADINGLWIFDALSTTQTLTDRSTLGGGTAHTVTLRGPTGTAVDACDLVPSVEGLCPNLCFDANTWDTPDSDDFTYGTGSADSAFSIVALVEPALTAADQVILAKMDFTTAATQREWWFWFDQYYVIKLELYDDSTGGYIGQMLGTYNGDNNEWHTYGAVYTGSGAASGISIYRDGVVLGTGSSSSGSYTAMENKTAAVGNYYTSTAGARAGCWLGRYGVVLVVNEALTAAQMARLHVILAGYSGTDF